MRKRNTYGELIESLAAFIGLLGVVLCLQTSVATVQLQEDAAVIGVEKHCCIQAAEHAHGHTESSARSEQLTAGVPASQQLVKGFGDAASLQKEVSLLQLQAYNQEVRQQGAIHSAALLLSKRHIRYRSIII